MLKKKSESLLSLIIDDEEKGEPPLLASAFFLCHALYQMAEAVKNKRYRARRHLAQKVP